MSSNLVIVESPNKIKKIQSFLGNTYDVSASMGHITGISKDGLGIDIKNNFKPKYIVTHDKKKVVRELKKRMGSNTIVWLATDYDREGEAIAFHLAEELKVPLCNQKRILFTSITKKAILDSIANPTKIDMNMFNSQQARSILDKLIGFKISPILWANFKNYKLSAGRVQSVVVKIVLEREEEIEQFDSSGYYKLTAGFNLSEHESDERIKKMKKPYTQDKLDINTDINTESNSKIVNCSIIKGFNSMVKDKDIHFQITSLKKNNTKRRPQAPYITSTLQQDASNKLGMSPDTCMRCAQKLYEAGHITYMRTDSLMLSDDALNDIKTFVTDNYGEKYYKRTQYTKKGKNAQEAHEACRPTKATTRDVFGRDGITSPQNRLYKLIWTRTIASQMTPAELEIRTVKISPIIDTDTKCKKIAKDTEIDKRSIAKTELNELKSVKGKEVEIKDKNTYIENIKVKKSDIKKNIEEIEFIGKHEKIIFDGFLKASGFGSTEKDEDEDEKDDEEESVARKLVKSHKSKKLEELFGKLKKGDKLYCFYLNSEEKFTKPPHARYTEASLVKKLDELGIGRPSTYASMIQKVQDRNYVIKQTKEADEKDISVFSFAFGMDDITLKSKTIKIGGDKNKLFPTSLGNIVTKFLSEQFTDIMNYGFTADVECMLDEIAKGEKIWYKVVQVVYDKFNPIVDKLSKNIKDKPGNEIILGINPDTENEIKIISTRFGMAVAEKDSSTGKAKYASLRFATNKMTLESALMALKFPAELGSYKGHIIELCFKDDYFLKYNEKFISIKNYNTKMKDNPVNIIKAIELVKTNNKMTDVEEFDPCKCVPLEDAIRVLKDQENTNGFERKVNDDIEIKNGKFGYYFKYKGDNVGIPYKYKKTPDLLKGLTVAECMELITEKNNKKKGIVVTNKDKPTTKNKKDAKTEATNKGMIKEYKKKTQILKSNIGTDTTKKTVDIPKQILEEKPKKKKKKDTTVDKKKVVKPKKKKDD
jgi:DNA topoisomerase I